MMVLVIASYERLACILIFIELVQRVKLSSI
jgi:hypothetical protein